MTREELQKTIDVINATEDAATLQKRMEMVREIAALPELALQQAPIALAVYGPQGFLAYAGEPYSVYMEKAREIRADFRKMMMVAEARLVVLKERESAHSGADAK